jgi:hypothetical protein
MLLFYMQEPYNCTRLECLIQWNKTHNDVPLISTEMVCCVEFVLVFFFSKDADVYLQRTITQKYSTFHPYKHLRNTEPEVNTGISLSTDMSPTTERIAPVKYWNNSEKCENPCRVYNIKSG